MSGRHLALPRLSRLLWLQAVLVSLSGCERGDPPREGVEIARGECGGYLDPNTNVQFALRARPLDIRDPMRLLLSLELSYGPGGYLALEDPRVWPAFLDPSGSVDPVFESTYPPVLLRVGEIDVANEVIGEWTVLLPSVSSAAPAIEPRALILDPSVELSFLWVAPKPGRYTLQGISGAYGSAAQRTTQPRCQGDAIDPVCFAQTFTEFHFEVPAP